MELALSEGGTDSIRIVLTGPVGRKARNIAAARQAIETDALALRNAAAAATTVSAEDAVSMSA